MSHHTVTCFRVCQKEAERYPTGPFEVKAWGAGQRGGARPGGHVYDGDGSGLPPHVARALPGLLPPAPLGSGTFETRGHFWLYCCSQLIPLGL